MPEIGVLTRHGWRNCITLGVGKKKGRVHSTSQSQQMALAKDAYNLPHPKGIWQGLIDEMNMR